MSRTQWGGYSAAPGQRLHRPKKTSAGAPSGNAAAPGEDTIGPGDITTLPDQSWADSTYNDTTSGIGKNLANLGTFLNGQGVSLSGEYGVDTGGADPTAFDPAHPPAFGIAANVDVTNPFSKAALLQRSFQQQSRGDGNRMAASGQLYGGSYQNAQNADTFGFQQGRDALLKDFASRWSGLGSQYLNGQNSATDQGIAAQTAAFARHANDPVAPPRKAFTPAGAAKFGKLLKNSKLYQGWRNHG